MTLRALHPVERNLGRGRDKNQGAKNTYHFPQNFQPIASPFTKIRGSLNGMKTILYV
jgi:hypothetical protein